MRNTLLMTCSGFCLLPVTWWALPALAALGLLMDAFDPAADDE